MPSWKDSAEIVAREKAVTDTLVEAKTLHESLLLKVSQSLTALADLKAEHVKALAVVEATISEAKANAEQARVILIHAQMEYDLLFPPPPHVDLPTGMGLKILAACQEGASIDEICKAVERKRPYVAVYLGNLVGDGHLYRPQRGYYRTRYNRLVLMGLRQALRPTEPSPDEIPE